MSGSRCVRTSSTSGTADEDRALDLLGDVVRALEREVAGELEMERDLEPSVDLEDAEVVDLPHLRDAERGRQHALAELGVRLARLDVDDDVGVGQRSRERVLDPVGGGMALPDGGARSDPDDDVGEVLAARLAHPEPPELDRRVERGDRRPRRVLGVDAGVRSMSTSTFRRRSRAAAATITSAATKSAAIASPSGNPSAAADEAGEHRERAREVAAEMERVREQRVAAVPARGAQRDRPCATRRSRSRARSRRTSTRSASTSDSTTPTRRATARPAMRTLIRIRNAASASAARCCGLAVAPRVPAVGRANRDRDGEEREQRRREIGPRVRGLGEEAEAPAREPRGELDRDQEAGGPDRDERGAALRRHGP